jgi:DNA-directed RNA polymerase specialized sigma24 family protein
MDRQVCELCLVEGRPYKEVATLLGSSVGAIKQRVARSRARLRKAVIENEG